MAVVNVELLKLGLRIKTSRKKLGWSQKDFSTRCGLEKGYFGGVERGERNLTFSILCQICRGLNCDIAAFTVGIPHLEEALKEAGRQLPNNLGSRPIGPNSQN
jgi:transcriptional regulator with XRE-family HTH domain